MGLDPRIPSLLNRSRSSRLASSVGVEGGDVCGRAGEEGVELV